MLDIMAVAFSGFLFSMGGMFAKLTRLRKRFRTLVISPLALGLCKVLGIKPRRLFYDQIGVAMGHQPEKSGEIHFLKHELPKLLNRSRPLVFDVGANQGDYAELVREYLPQAKIIAFEPGPAAFVRLQNRRLQDTEAFPYALADKAGQAMLYDHGQQEGSEHASLFGEVFVDVYHSRQVQAHKVKVMTLDGFCQQARIPRIDFLKIDVEGAELRVLQGAKKLLAQGAIQVVQFEFNEMNVTARVFLKDFYDLLPDYDFFRVTPKGLLRLGEYHPKNEIFAYQNIVAVRR